MSTKAYILIETVVGKSREVQATLKGVSGIEAVDAVTGPYDIISVVVRDNLNDVGELVSTRVHTIGGILRTVTCLSLGLS